MKPNDGDCHLDAAGYYSESLNQDYPSISQISNKIADKKASSTVKALAAVCSA